MPRLISPPDYPQTMLRYAEEAVTLTRNRSRDDLDNDRIFELALAHLVQNVGTAAETTRRNRQLWNGQLAREREMLYALRNRIAYDTDPMERSELWHMATVTFPAIIPPLQAIVRSSGALG